MTPCKEKQLFWKSSALSLCLISPHPTRVSMEAEEGAGSLRLQIAASSPPAPEPEETNGSLKIKQNRNKKKKRKPLQIADSQCCNGACGVQAHDS